MSYIIINKIIHNNSYKPLSQRKIAYTYLICCKISYGKGLSKKNILLESSRIFFNCLITCQSTKIPRNKLFLNLIHFFLNQRRLMIFFSFYFIVAGILPVSSPHPFFSYGKILALPFPRFSGTSFQRRLVSSYSYQRFLCHSGDKRVSHYFSL